ncbi:MAG: hypothetical protein HC866_19615 [Leptolyngbyaceae cyanobacterium RU_5_1]|nr:hypothetical protein [Leptolyngbyaceae cyanobacterium RU_5_1]
MKRKEYLQNHLISGVRQMVSDRHPYTEILKFIQARSHPTNRTQPSHPISLALAHSPSSPSSPHLPHSLLPLNRL